MQWIRDKARVGIYDRDTPAGQKSPACVYCGFAVRVGLLPSESELRAATLDHVDPAGPNSPENLVTACAECNWRKRGRTLRDWVAGGGGVWRNSRRAPPRNVDGYFEGARDRELTVFERVALALGTAAACASPDCDERRVELGELRRENAAAQRMRARARRRRK